MVRQKDTIDRLLIILLNLLLAFLISVITFGGKEVISNQKKQTEAINALKIVLTEHDGRISGLEKNDQKQDEKIDDLDNRVHRLED